MPCVCVYKRHDFGFFESINFNMITRSFFLILFVLYKQTLRVCSAFSIAYRNRMSFFFSECMLTRFRDSHMHSTLAHIDRVSQRERPTERKRVKYPELTSLSQLKFNLIILYYLQSRCVCVSKRARVCACGMVSGRVCFCICVPYSVYTSVHGKLANYIALWLGYDYGIPVLIYHISTTFVRLIYDFYLLLFPISSLLFFGLFVACVLLFYRPLWLFFRIFFRSFVDHAMQGKKEKRSPNFSRYWCYFNKRLNIFIIWMCVTMIHEYPIAFA